MTIYHDYANKLKNNQSNELCMETIKYDGQLLQYINKPTEDMILMVVGQNGSALEYVKNQTKEICREAIKNDKYAKRYINEDLLEDLYNL